MICLRLCYFIKEGGLYEEITNVVVEIMNTKNV